MPFALNLIYLATLLLFAPVLIYRMIRSGKYREGLWEKFWGDAPRRIGDRPCLWFHAVSVGEVLLAQAAGQGDGPTEAELGGRHLDDHDDRTGRGSADLSRPDHLLCPSRLQLGHPASDGAHPADGAGSGRARALAEPDPGRESVRGQGGDHQRPAQLPEATGDIAVCVGRWEPRLRCIDVVAAQDADYARRFVELGVPSDRVSVTGSVKYDGLESDRNNARTRDLRKELGLSHSDLVFVAGSTMEGEEAAALAAYRAARLQHPSLRLILVPRHAERFDSVADVAGARTERPWCVAPSSARGRMRRLSGLERSSSRHPDRHDRRAGGGLGPGRRRVRGGKPGARPRGPEHDGAGRLRRLGSVRSPHVQLPRDRRAASGPQRRLPGRRMPTS